LGEQYKTSPPIFNEIKRILKDKIVQFGYLENYDDYVEWLKKSDIVISTSHQENFGISIVDAIGYGSFPLLPDRLSYRELISEEFHNLCIYKNLNDLKKKLIKLIQFYDTDILKNIIKQNYRFSWKNQIIEFDNKLNWRDFQVQNYKELNVFLKVFDNFEFSQLANSFFLYLPHSFSSNPQHFPCFFQSKWSFSG
jgi:glycosyltransferase involved in cell wall biosynthesis